MNWVTHLQPFVFITTPMVQFNLKFYNVYLNTWLVHNTRTHFSGCYSVIPASPFNIITTQTTQSSVMLKWSLGSMTHFPQELIHKIEYGSRRNSSTERRRVSVDCWLTDENLKRQCVQLHLFFTVYKVRWSSQL